MHPFQVLFGGSCCVLNFERVFALDRIGPAVIPSHFILCGTLDGSPSGWFMQLVVFTRKQIEKTLFAIRILRKFSHHELILMILRTASRRYR